MMATRKAYNPDHITKTMVGLLTPFSAEQRRRMLDVLGQKHRQLVDQDRRGMSGNKPKMAQKARAN